MKTFDEALNWINSRLRFGIKPGLERMQWMLERLGSPEKKLNVIHVGGTNGKGSTVSYIRSILNEAGYEVGTFTSPYIEEFNERISINGTPISNEEIVDLTNIVKPLAEELENTDLGSLTEFEVITVMAIYYFAHLNQMDFTVFEVGLGGRLDSTNVLEPILTIITNIGMDHTNILGDTLQEIAKEKAGIIKKGIPLITTAKQGEVLDVFNNTCIEKGSEILLNGQQFKIENQRHLDDGEKFSLVFNENKYTDLQVSMLGAHQVENAALAVVATSMLKIKEEHIRSGLEKAFWPGRMEIIKEHPLVLVDGAHNPEGIRALAKTINTHYPEKKKKIIFAALRDKELKKMFAELKAINGHFYFTQFENPRVASAKELLEDSKFLNAESNENWELLLENVYKSLDKDEILIISGSLYFISDVKTFFKRQRI